MSQKVLILPGIGNSGSEHWQTHWENAHPDFTRVAQKDWKHPVRAEWVAALEQAVADAGPETVLVAHSLACLLVVHWAASSALPIRAALLVAVPDADGPNFPAEAIGFSPVPQNPLPFVSIVVASTNDPYGSVTYVTRCAEAWGSRLICVGERGHINSASALGDWPEGYAILRPLIE